MNELWPNLWLSIEIATAASLVCCIIGIPLAYLMAKLRFVGKSALEAGIMIPLVLPPTVVGYLILATMGRRGWLGSWLSSAFDYSIAFRFEGAVIAAAIVAIPMLYMPTKAAFQGIDGDLVDMARSSGANPLQVFWHIILPLARRGILSGLVLAFARALGEFGATVMVFGWQPNRLTLPISVYADYERDDLVHAIPAVVALMVISFAMIFVYNRSVPPTKSN